VAVHLRVIGDGDHGEPQAAGLEDGGRPGALEVRAGADRLDPSRVEVGKRVEQRVFPEVERVIVGKRDAVDAEVRQGLHRPGRSPKVEDPSRRRFTARGDAALQVEHDEVGLANDVDELRGEEFVVWSSASRCATARPSIVSPASASFTEMA